MTRCQCLLTQVSIYKGLTEQTKRQTSNIVRPLEQMQNQYQSIQIIIRWYILDVQAKRIVGRGLIGRSEGIRGGSLDINGGHTRVAIIAGRVRRCGASVN
jgi:hypothetical protein